MKYTGYSLSFQEVPGEVSLAISISNCPFRCSGCHSAYLQTDVGEILTSEILDTLLNPFYSKHTVKPVITCIVFFGGEQHHKEFIELALYIHSLGLKVCLYTGAELSDIPKDIVEVCDYIKTGQYIAELGPLTKSTTNQKLYDIISNLNITHKFWEK